MILALLITGLVLSLAAGMIAVDAALAGDWDEESVIVAWARNQLASLRPTRRYRGSHRSSWWATPAGDLRWLAETWVKDVRRFDTAHGALVGWYL